MRTRTVDEVLDMIKHGLRAGKFAPRQDSFAVAKKRQARARSVWRLRPHAVLAAHRRRRVRGLRMQGAKSRHVHPMRTPCQHADTRHCLASGKRLIR